MDRRSHENCTRRDHRGAVEAAQRTRRLRPLNTGLRSCSSATQAGKVHHRGRLESSQVTSTFGRRNLLADRHSQPVSCKDSRAVRQLLVAPTLERLEHGRPGIPRSAVQLEPQLLGNLQQERATLASVCTSNRRSGTATRRAAPEGHQDARCKTRQPIMRPVAAHLATQGVYPRPGLSTTTRAR